jgi:DNA replication protein DnaC
MDPLLAQLRQLRMTAMATALEQQRLTPHAYAELSFEERLGLLTEQEHISRDNNRIQRLRKQANFRIKAEPEGLRYP